MSPHLVWESTDINYITPPCNPSASQPSIPSTGPDLRQPSPTKAPPTSRVKGTSAKQLSETKDYAGGKIKKRRVQRRTKGDGGDDVKRGDDWGAAGSRVTVMRRGSPRSGGVRRSHQVSNGRRPSRMPPQVQTKAAENETSARRRLGKIE
ncbi:hypothetical protein E2C01_081327 [Portunus trituberculatus]|uniref:Uncharacterized protein n=1 Tax=Portunus trituberculatus TaxID=210409 RepID=A0A5B7IYH9_PORTR|nr:hypothetical protein [Portunus trituberculatus]